MRRHRKMHTSSALSTFLFLDPILAKTNQFTKLVRRSIITHAKHGEANAGLGHDEHGALDDARRLDVPPASRTDQARNRN